MMNQHETPLLDALNNHIETNPTAFHIPGHKNGKGINPKFKNIVGNSVFNVDLSELHELDDLHLPKGAIKKAQDLAADAWGADNSFFLVNGTSAGIIASICSVVSENDTLILPRNAHKAAIFGLIASGATPAYISPEIDSSHGLPCGFLPEKLNKAFTHATNAKAVFGVSPTYHGICSDVKSLAKIAHDNNCIYIADEAHGSHVYFHKNLPSGALELGADISCQSTHKMSGSLTQSSILHIKSNLVDTSKIIANLQFTQSTSPSYLLMSSLDAARSYIATEGESIFDNLLPRIKSLIDEIKTIPGIEVLDGDLIGKFGVFDFEPMRIVFSANKLGVSGYELYDILRNDYNIETEYGDHCYVICVMGIGTRNEDLDALAAAIKDISNRDIARVKPDSSQIKSNATSKETPPEIPPMKMTPREAWFSEHEIVPWNNSLGRISAQMITPYPPGIPTICPGEIISKDIWDYLDNLSKSGRHIHGSNGDTLDQVRVVK